jgi:hypothetical protein
MGLATGEVVIGTIGAPTAKSYAAIGDITNLASRLEGVNKVYGTTVILAEETYRLAQQAIDARDLDTVIVVGKSEPVRIFELLGRAGEVDAVLLELRDLYVEGLAAYRRQDWDTAEQRFTECLRQCPDDGPAAVLRERSVAFRAPPPPDWDGVCTSTSDGRHIIVWLCGKTCDVQGVEDPLRVGSRTRTSRTRNDKACRSARRSSPSPTRRVIAQDMSQRDGDRYYCFGWVGGGF